MVLLFRSHARLLAKTTALLPPSRAGTVLPPGQVFLQITLLRQIQSCVWSGGSWSARRAPVAPETPRSAPCPLAITAADGSAHGPTRRSPGRYAPRLHEGRMDSGAGVCPVVHVSGVPKRVLRCRCRSEGQDMLDGLRTKVNGRVRRRPSLQYLVQIVASLRALAIYRGRTVSFSIFSITSATPPVDFSKTSIL